MTTRNEIVTRACGADGPPLGSSAASSLERSDYNIAFTLILVLGIFVMVTGLALSTVLGTVTGLPDVASIGAAMFLASPLVFANAIPVTMLDRALDFKRIAAIELATQLSNVGVAIPLALSGARQ